MSADFIWAMADVTESKAEWIDRLNQTTDEAFETLDHWSIPDEDVRGRIAEAIDVCYDYMNRSDMGWFSDERGGGTYVFSGGMSWGDSPTEAFDDIWVFSEFQGLWY